MTDKEIMQMALDALELVTDLTNHDDEVYAAIEALRARLTQPEPEPVAWMHDSHVGFNVPLYTAPPQREWQGLTDEEIVENALQEVFSAAFGRGAKWAEAKLKEKNNAT